MSHLIRHARLLAVAVSCLALGAGAGVISSAGAAGPSSAASAPASAQAGTHARGAWRALARRSVHAELVVATKSGFKTVTVDRGFLDSVSGHTLTLREGTRKATYKTVTLTVPDSARVRNRGQKASLSSLRAGEHVLVVQGPMRAFVLAR